MGREHMLTYLLLFLHFIALPVAILVTLIGGYYDLALLNALAFALLFIIWHVMRKQ